MEDKYYVPKIEEFHAGFEFELQEYTHEEPTGGWHEAMFGRLLIHNEGGMYSTDLKDVVRWIKDDDVRVKYLDRQDIESLGWNILEDESPFKNLVEISTKKEYEILCKGTNGRLIMEHDFFSHKITIKHPNFIRDGSGRFDGYYNRLYRVSCKNKSELKRLMNMLNIIVPAK